MILPRKHISVDRCLLGTGAQLLQNLDTTRSISDLWHDLHEKKIITTFETFILTMDFLFLIGSITLDSEGRVKKKYAVSRGA